MRNWLSIVLLLLVMSFYGCAICDEDECLSFENITSVSFTNTGVTSQSQVMFFIYPPDHSFIAPIDSFGVVDMYKSTTGVYTVRPARPLDANFDYRVKIIDLGRSYDITQITVGEQECDHCTTFIGKGKAEKVKVLEKYKLDGKWKQPFMFETLNIDHP